MLTLGTAKIERRPPPAGGAVKFSRQRDDENEPFECPHPITCQFPRCDCGKDEDEDPVS